MGTQHNLWREKKGVLHLARRVISRNVEGGKVVIVVLDIRAAGDGESHRCKDIDGLVQHLQQRMQGTAWTSGAGDSDINALGRKATGVLFFLPASAQGSDAFFEERLDLVGRLTDDPTLFGRQLTESAQD